MDKRILLIREQLLTKIQSPPSVEELAAQINISPSRLRQMFKTETNMPFVEYVRHLQMERARELLETTFMRVQEIWVAAGFRDQSFFNRAFEGKIRTDTKKIPRRESSRIQKTVIASNKVLFRPNNCQVVL